MRLSDIQNKDIIKVSDGSLLGNIIDVEINNDGNVVSLIVFNKKGSIFSFKTKDEIYVNWGEINKIGEDVILVDKSI